MAEIIALCDNTSITPEYETEHGVSLAVRLDSGAFLLWDTGQSDLFLRNAKRLDIDPGTADALILSHGHYDHTGGIAALLETTNFSGAVYAHPDFSIQRYTLRSFPAREIGLPITKLALPIPGFVPVKNHLHIVPNTTDATVFTNITRRPGNSQATTHFYLDPEGLHPDAVVDDACILIHTSKGYSVILGCCHSGPANTLHHIRAKTGVTKLHALIGGLHLVNGPQTAIQETAETIMEFDIQEVYPAHCTGERGNRGLRSLVPERIKDFGAGIRIRI